MDEDCGDCKFFIKGDRETLTLQLEDCTVTYEGWCQRYPPSLITDKSYDYPMVNEGHCCGEFTQTELI